MTDTPDINSIIGKKSHGHDSSSREVGSFYVAKETLVLTLSSSAAAADRGQSLGLRQVTEEKTRESKPLHTS